MKELLSIFPPKVVVHFGDKDVEIKSVELQDMAIVGELGDKLFSKAIALLKMKLSPDDLGLAIAQELTTILKNDTKLLIDFLAVTTTVEKSTLQKISIEAALFLITEVIEVNKDFLSQKIVPKAKALAALFVKKEKTNG